MTSRRAASSDLASGGSVGCLRSTSAAATALSTSAASRVSSSGTAGEPAKKTPACGSAVPALKPSNAPIPTSATVRHKAMFLSSILPTPLVRRHVPQSVKCDRRDRTTTLSARGLTVVVTRHRRPVVLRRSPYQRRTRRRGCDAVGSASRSRCPDNLRAPNGTTARPSSAR
jgi:hypothetical protein